MTSAPSPDQNAAPLNLRPWILPGIVAAVVVVGVHEGSASFQRHEAGKDGGATIYEAREFIRHRFVRPVDDAKLDRGAVTGMTSILDPFSAFVPPRKVSEFQEATSGEFGGLGIMIALEAGLVRIMTPLEGSPAWEAGMLPGDLIIRIDGETYEFASIYDAADRLKGKPGTLVQIALQRDGVDHPLDFTIERAVIRVRSVRGTRMVDPDNGIGYIRVTAFQRDTVPEASAAIETLVKQGLRGLIIDLRANPGGLLNGAFDFCDLFVSDGLIVETRGRDPTLDQRSYTANQETLLPDTPLVVLLDGYSASASEIVGGALSDHGRAVLIGSRSYGKGSVQTVFDLEGGVSILKLTTASYYTPSGRSIHRKEAMDEEDEWGLMPDIETPVTPTELRTIFRWQEDAEVRRLASEARKTANGTDDQPPAPVSTARPAAATAVSGATLAAAASQLAASRPAVPPVDPAVEAAVESLIETLGPR